jgi:predicted aspartyl protease
MGAFRVRVEIAELEGTRFDTVEALVDTVATYTWLPADLLNGLGVRPQEERPFVLADGRQVTYRIGWIQVRLDKRTQPTIAVFGEPGSESLLGVFTLDGFGVAADPVNRRLMPVPALLKRCRHTCDNPAAAGGPASVRGPRVAAREVMGGRSRGPGPSRAACERSRRKSGARTVRAARPNRLGWRVSHGSRIDDRADLLEGPVSRGIMRVPWL